MSTEIPPVAGAPGSAQPARRCVGQSVNGSARVPSEDTPPSVFGGPDAEASAAVERAAAVARELHARGRELRFGIDESGRVRITLCDLDGNVLRPIAPREALDIAEGRQPVE